MTSRHGIIAAVTLSGAGVLDVDRLIDRLADLDSLARRRRANVRVVRAPGRVNLIGEHTDYNEGLVLPAAIDLETWIAYLPTRDRRVTLSLDDSSETASFELDAIGPPRRTWIDYVAGTARALEEAGVTTTGLRGIVTATLPREVGLSSSASLELAAAWALIVPQQLSIAPLALARICQRAENEYVGVRCGLMDQAVVACAEVDSALLLDCRSLAYHTVPLPRDDLGDDALTLVVCYSGSRRRLGTSQYNARRAECERSVRDIARIRPDVRSLRDLATEDLGWVEQVLGEQRFRRVRHVVTENARVSAVVEALGGRDPAALGRLFAEGHASLRDDYEVSSPELDLLVEVATRTPGVVAARMTGAGFGGCTVNLVERGAVERLRDAMKRDYAARTGLTPAIWALRAVAGAGAVRG